MENKYSTISTDIYEDKGVVNHENITEPHTICIKSWLMLEVQL